MKRDSFVMVHIGQRPLSRRNLQFGIETRSWGFPEWKPEYRSARPRFAVLATGVAPPVPLNVWLTQRITLYLFEVREGFHEGRAPHWPDEEAENAVKYPVRFGIVPLATVHDAPLGEPGPLPLAGSDAIRRSGIERGIGKLCDLDPQSLFDAAGIQVDWAPQQKVPLNRTPGFTAEQVEAPKTPKSRRSGAGFISDPKKRKAVPYNLRCTRGREERHVEVKGTTGAATSVELTINEVEHARSPQHTVDLYVVSDISVDMRSPDYTASGGRVAHLTDWSPAEEDLRPRRFEYRLPFVS
ncbi:protein NO VEIN domain-containing protein [Streptomyces davaonensis]|uniref:protein NO VEIN domain-containing protein n=1 Tax=Streptomyces davaonensis TaxID=348043 RepID=UPI001E3C1B5E|nr:DUF3883 domain-containing protein [Streptomyces davaonensis]